VSCRRAVVADTACSPATPRPAGGARSGLLHPTTVPVGGHLQPPGPEARTSLPLGQVCQRRSCELGLPLAITPDPGDLSAQQRDRRANVGHHSALGGHRKLPELGPRLEGSFDVLEQSFHRVEAIAVPFQHRLGQAQRGA